MMDDADRADEFRELRRLAEIKAQEHKFHVALDKLMSQSPEEICRVLHELRVHQIELELQNEELRRTQVELDATRARYFDLYDLAPVGYITVAESGLIQEANLTAANLLNVSRGSLTKCPLTRYIAPEDQDTYYRHRKQLLKDGNPQVCEIRMIQSAAPPLWVRLEATLVEAEDGTRVSRVVLSNISEKKHAELEQEKLRTELTHVQKIESVGRLAGGVAHEFNNMLSVILGHVEIATEQVGPNSPVIDNLESICKAAKRSADLTRQLLSFARKQMTVPRLLNLNVTIDAQLDLIRQLLGEKVDLTWRPQTDLWPVQMDPSQVEQIITALCLNAQEATTSGGHLLIETRNISLDAAYCAEHPDSRPGDYALLRVTDDGAGMNQEMLENVFEPFFTTKEFGANSGLELAAIYGIVKQNQGSIQVFSQLNGGTTFEVYLPRSLTSVTRPTPW